MSGYVIITPVRDEEAFIEGTIRSVVSQTALPLQWVIVDDGSTDRTAEIVGGYLAANHWIKLVRLTDRGYYHAGAGVVEAFYKGYENLSATGYDFIVKLDGDVSFERGYFEMLLKRFDEDRRLGIASGSLIMPVGGSFVMEDTQPDHPIGASKMYRKECFLDIGGLKAIPGWDTADVLTAQMKGWETRRFPDISFVHYRPTGTRRKGISGGKFYLGRMQYRFGYTLSYTLLKAAYRSFERPYIIGSLSLVAGYMASLIKGEGRLFDEELVRFLRAKHRKYLLDRLSFRRAA